VGDNSGLPLRQAGLTHLIQTHAWGGGIRCKGEEKARDAPEQRGTMMCEGKIDSAMKSSGSGTFTATSRIMHLPRLSVLLSSHPVFLRMTTLGYSPLFIELRRPAQYGRGPGRQYLNLRKPYCRCYCSVPNRQHSKVAPTGRRPPPSAPDTRVRLPVGWETP
jgi:hypothetical protein